MTRVAVIGHVEWVEHARLHEPLERGAIIQLHDTFEEPAGGGGVAARALPSLGAETRFYTALGNDAAGEASERVLRQDGCELRIARRSNPQARVTTVVEPGGERTILLHGMPDHPTIEDPLGWDDLAGFDGVFYTGNDPRTVVAARRARVLVVTARRLPSVVASRVQVDVLAGSARDHGERYELADLPVRPRLCVWTEGADGGHYLADDDSEGRWEAVSPPGAIVDSYGAGDVFMAALTLELARGSARDEALALAARASAAQLTRRGGGPS
ncbi:MAG TPA: PfkB family carbohydrate kinase [Gaiellales bacterium]|nr:PfkB family carbohydrate kinase [Gaiellales bacterium]